MPLVVISFNIVPTSSDNHPQRCPTCGCQVLQSWGKQTRAITDTQIESAEVHRYHCTGCDSTFRHYPEGIDHTGISQRLRKLAALIWVIGLSSSEVVETFAELGVSLSRTVVWREGRDLAAQLRQKNPFETPRRYIIERFNFPGLKSPFGVNLALDVGSGKRAVLGTVAEWDPRRVIAWLEEMADDVDVRVHLVGTDIFYGTPHFTAPIEEKSPTNFGTQV